MHFFPVHCNEQRTLYNYLPNPNLICLYFKWYVGPILVFKFMGSLLKRKIRIIVGFVSWGKVLNCIKWLNQGVEDQWSSQISHRIFFNLCDCWLSSKSFPSLLILCDHWSHHPCFPSTHPLLPWVEYYFILFFSKILKINVAQSFIMTPLVLWWFYKRSPFVGATIIILFLFFSLICELKYAQVIY